MTNFRVVLDITADEAQWASEREYDLVGLENGSVKADMMDHIERSIELAYPDNAIDLDVVEIKETIDEHPEGNFV